MPPSVILVVLLGALLHATWNAIVKSGPDKQFATALVAGSAALMSGLALPFLSSPMPESWPYLAASVAVQSVYYLLLAAAYRNSDMSHAYPLMRGTAPLLVAIASGPLVGEHLSPMAWTGVLLICVGILGLVAGHWHRAERPNATIFALTNAAVIACYTIIDGIGVRVSRNPASYTMWIFLLTALPLLLWTLRRPSDLWCYARGRLRYGLIGGACTLASYGLALWAMTHATIAIVAALRETSILFGTAISILVLRERATPMRYVATGIIALGAILMRLA